MIKFHLNSLTASSLNISQTINDFFQLTKLRLSTSIVFSSLAGYLLASDKLETQVLLGLFFGGFAMVGASNAFNQLIEKNKDSLMIRTQNRPLPSGRMSNIVAATIATVLAVFGILILQYINFKTALFGALSIFLYTCIYTPLKSVTSLSVFVGAFPGAIPFMLGWVAATGSFGIEPGILFMIQFFWQFPHFWALAWKLDEDYQKAGFRLLPSIEKNKKSAFQIMLYSAFLIPSSMLPWAAEMTGSTSMIIGICLSLIMYTPAIRLYFTLDDKYANKIMYYSFAYLPILFTVYCFDLL